VTIFPFLSTVETGWAACGVSRFGESLNEHKGGGSLLEPALDRRAIHDKPTSGQRLAANGQSAQ
jgi:hypothetical protein